ncbi:MAG: hypothetical protein JSV19_07950 [Phycisphaerales bacterium]|nr:MAG: hypothetical protein JSV19_07950 [Phycisphaerales bacterium]
MASESIVVDRSPAPDGRTSTVTCDQAIYSSLRTLVGQGYQIIAASPGLTATEKKEITRRSPSHGGLCQDGPEAAAVGFYKLSTGRLAVAFSCDGGAEHTGRGVRRIYTHVTVLQADDFEKFGFNPSNVLIAVDRVGGLEVRLDPPRRLDPLTLQPLDRFNRERAAAAVGRFGAPWITYALSLVLRHMRLVVSGDLDPGECMEAILLGVPGPLRADVSFSAGLRFSVGRPYAVTVVAGNPEKTRRLVRGQRLEYLEPDTETPDPPDTPWLRMVRRRYEKGLFDAVAETAARPIDDCSDAGLDRIGRTCNNMDDAREADTRQLLHLAGDHLEAEAANDFEASLSVRLLRVVQSQLCNRLTSEPDVDAHWPELLSLLRRSRRGADFALPAVGAAVERLAQTAPVRAAEHILEAVRTVPGANVAERLQPSLTVVLESFRPWLAHATADRLDRAKSVLNEWQFKLPRQSALNSLLAQIERRQAE